LIHGLNHQQKNIWHQREVANFTQPSTFQPFPEDMRSTGLTVRIVTDFAVSTPKASGNPATNLDSKQLPEKLS
ncbi:MAG: hypothetical protein AAGM36_14330, partial [Cyanobacteria bacterium J06597_1]